MTLYLLEAHIYVSYRVRCLCIWYASRNQG